MALKASEFSRTEQWDGNADALYSKLRRTIKGEVNASPYLGLEVVCTTNRTDYEPKRASSGGVPGNRHSTFRKLAENVFEIY